MKELPVTLEEVTMKRKYECKSARLNKGAKREGRQSIMVDYNREGWRLVQIFAHGAGGLRGMSNFSEVIFGRETAGVTFLNYVYSSR